jgi:hypothetical protein
MATVTEDLKKDAGNVQADLVAHISALSKHHLSLSFGVIGVLVLVLAVMCVGGYLGLKSYEGQLARAEAAEKQYNADRKDLTAQLTASKSVQDTATKAQQVIVKVVHDRDVATDKKIADVTAPNKSAQEALSDLSAAYHGTILADPNAITADGRLVFPVFTVQGFTATRIDRDRLSDDLKSSADNLAQEQKKTESLAKDVAAANKAVADAQPAIAAYKKIAKHSRLRAFGAGALKVGIFVAGVYAGRKL